MRADSKTEAAVIEVLNQYAEAFASRDVDATLAFLAPDPDVTFIGTGGDEKRIGVADIRGLLERDFAQFEGASLKIGSPAVSAAGSVAWVVADLTMHASTRGREVRLQTRFTAVLERREEKWFVVQGHASLPAAGQEEGEAFPA